MPAIIQGSTGSQALSEVFDYEYPDGVNLDPRSDLHTAIKTKILERARESANLMSTRYPMWRQTDRFLTAYQYVDQKEKDVQALDSRKPVSIIFPHSYAILETLMSYMMAAFLVEPIFRYEGYSPEDVIGSILLEQVVNLHTRKFKVGLNLHTMFRDAFSYGLAPIVPTWISNAKGTFSGNALYNIDPYLYLPDPNVAADKTQDGEFVGWVQHTNYMDLLSEENAPESDFFNVKYLRGLTHRPTNITTGNSSDRKLRTGEIKSHSTNVLTSIDVIPMYVKLIPSEWKLGNSDVPEKWFFRLASDEIIITARSADFDHNKFPLSVCVPDFDGYSATPISRLEILGGLQHTLDFLFNSHIANVRKAINDMIIYDPFLVNSKDLKDPKPGKLIRMRRPAWGKGVKDAVQQLMVNDITRANISDSTFIVQWMQKIGGTDSPIMGELRQGGPERLTGAEFKGTQQGSINRLERVAKVIGMQVMQDLGEFFMDHTQQMMDNDAYIRINGRWVDTLIKEYGLTSGAIQRGRMKISPDDLDVFADVLVRDGSIPGGNFSEVWPQMFKLLAEHPELTQTFDIVRIFKHIARNNGAKNADDFIRQTNNIQPQIASDESVDRQIEAGNVIPIEGA